MSNVITIQTVEDKILDSSFNIDKIIHISDIHIKPSNERHNEYNTVFERFYEFLNKQKNPDKILTVITGDILDSEMTPYSTIQLKNFIINICKYTRCLAIAGNHDVLINRGIDELDKVTAILTKLQTEKPLYILNNDGNYHFKNVTFNFTTMFSKFLTDPKPKKSNVNIALYHGTIRDIVEFDVTNKYTNSGTFSSADFAEFDYALLGDIHKRHKIGENCYYSGSLIQQNIKEELIKGGYIFDLTKKKVEEFNIQNDYGEVVITIEKNGKTNIDLNILPKNIKTKFINKSLDDKLIEKIKMEFKKNNINMYESKIVHNLEENINTEVKIGNNSYDLTKITSKKNICELVEKYMVNNGITEEEQKKKIITLLSDIIDNNYNELGLEKNNNDINLKSREIKLKSLEFSNIGCYGKDNYINFSDMNKHKIIGLCATNDYGKSSIIDVLILAISGKSIKNCTKSDIINDKEKNALIKLIIQVNNDIYCINRKYTKKTDKKTEETITISKLKDNTLDISDFDNFKLICKDENNDVDENDNNDNAEIDDIEDKEENDNKDVIKTLHNKSSDNLNSNIFIRDNICSANDLLLTSIIDQNRDISILNNSPQVFISLLLKYGGVSIFNDIKKLCMQNKRNRKIQRNDIVNSIDDTGDLLKYLGTEKKSTKKNKFKKVKYNKFDYDKYEKDYSNEVDDFNNKIKSLDDEILEFTNEIIVLEKSISNMDGQISTLEEYDLDVDEISESIKKYNDLNKLLENKLIELKNNLTNDKKDIKKLEKSIKKYNNIEEEKDKFELEKEKNIQDYKNKIKNLQKELLNDNKLNIDKVTCEKELNQNNKILKDTNDDITKLNKKLTLFTLDGIIKTYEEYILFSKNQTINVVMEILDKHKFKNKDTIKNEISEHINNVSEDIEQNYIEIKNEKDINKSYNNVLNLVNKKNTEKNNIIKQIEYIENRSKNIDIHEKLIIFEEKLENIKNMSFEKYDEYIQLKEKIEDLNENIENMENKIKNNQTEIDKNNMLIKIEKDKLLKGQKNKEQKIKFDEFKIEINKIRNKVKIIEFNKNLKLKEKNDLYKKLNEKTLVYGQNKTKIELYKKYTEEIDLYDKLIIIFNNHLIPCMLKDKIIPK